MIIVATPLWLVCALLVWREQSLYVRQSRAARAFERWLLRSSPPILRVAPTVNRHLRLGRRTLDEGQVTTQLLTVVVGPVRRPSSSVPVLDAGALATPKEAA